MRHECSNPPKNHFQITELLSTVSLEVYKSYQCYDSRKSQNWECIPKFMLSTHLLEMAVFLLYKNCRNDDLQWSWQGNLCCKTVITINEDINTLCYKLFSKWTQLHMRNKPIIPSYTGRIQHIMNIIHTKVKNCMYELMWKPQYKKIWKVAIHSGWTVWVNEDN